jgi:hypothetical protein
LAKTREALAARPNIRILQELEAELSELQERLRPWDEELDSQLAGLHAALRRLDTIAAVWEATAEVARVFVVVASVSIWVETLEELKVLVSAYGEWPRRVGRFIQYAL